MSGAEDHLDLEAEESDGWKTYASSDVGLVADSDVGADDASNARSNAGTSANLHAGSDTCSNTGLEIDSSHCADGSSMPELLATES